jgi:hypothetical protein
MSFTIAAVATSIADLLMGLRWRVAGGLLLKQWGIGATHIGLLASLGLVEFRARRVGKGILVNVVIEVLLAAGFAAALFTWFPATCESTSLATNLETRTPGTLRCRST